MASHFISLLLNTDILVNAYQCKYLIKYSAYVHSLPGGIDLWQAGLLFITEYRYILVIQISCLRCKISP
jgi:hypothetical protein